MLSRINVLSIKQVLLLCCIFISSCDSSSNSIDTTHAPLAFTHSDECHLCGMVISRFPGPKGQAFDKRSKRMLKFCSTKELMSWYLQPDNKINVSEIYVHDMGRSPWHSPKNSHLISAKGVWFVTGSNMKGSMGNTLGTFADKKQALEFIKKHKGQLHSFSDVLNKGHALFSQ